MVDFIHNNKFRYGIEAICTILPITSSTYYRHLDWVKHPEKRSKRALHKIDGYTWHHNAQSAPNNMQLVPFDIHTSKGVPHTGQNALKDGR